MRKIGAWIWKFCLGLFVLLFMVWAVFFVRLDLNVVKDQIIASVHEITGRELEISGGLHLEFFPHFVVRADNVVLHNAADFDGPFLSMTHLDLRARVFPLLLSRLEVEAVTIEGLELYLELNSHGRNNWADMWDNRSETPPVFFEGKQGLSDVLMREERIPILASLIVDGLHVSGGRVHWVDRRRDETVVLEDALLDVSNFTFDAPFMFQLGGRLQRKKSDGLVSIRLSTGAVLSRERFQLQNTAIQAEITGSMLAQGKEHVALTVAGLDSDGNADNVHFQGIGLDIRGDAREVHKELIQGSLHCQPFRPIDVASRFGLDVSKFSGQEILHHAQMSFDWVFDSNILAVSAMTFSLDETTVQGSVNAALGDNQCIAFSLHADTINTDRYRHLFDKSTPTDTSDVGEQNGRNKPSEFLLHHQDWLQSACVNGTLLVDSCVIKGLSMRDVELHGSARAGEMRLEKIRLNAYEGTFDATAALVRKDDIPQVTWSHHVSGIELGPLLADLHGKVMMTGSASSNASLSSSGLSLNDLKRALRGTVSYKVVHGTLDGVNIPVMLRDEIRSLKGQNPGPVEPAVTHFDVISGHSDIAQGEEETRDLVLLAPRFRIDGRGRTDLVQETLSYSLLITLAGTQGRFHETAFGLHAIPLQVSGSFDAPSVTVDTPELIKGMGVRGGQAVQDTLKGVGSEINHGARELMRGLFP